MRDTSGTVGALLLWGCVFLALASLGIGAIGVGGVRVTAETGQHLAENELATLDLTARLGHDSKNLQLTVQALDLTRDPARRARLHDTLYNDQIPTVEADLIAMKQAHASDHGGEQKDLDPLVQGWSDVREQINHVRSTTDGGGRRMFSEQLAAAFTGFDDEIGALSRAERADADKDEAIAEKVRRRVEGAIVAAATAAVLGCVAFIWLGRWRYRRAAEPMHRQVEFTDALQLAESEEEAHGLLHRHLERSVSGSTVAVLNRNNSADRLEPVTPVAAGSPLATGLEHAEPRSCLAVRSGTTHEENHQGLLACGVCGPCPGRSICTPLTVGSEVIGAVLVNRSGLYRGEDRQCVRESVSQAAPVLANLRNLALAEQRAATDSLTGLPNKRMVGDTIKRMLAAASRASAPLCLLMLDLDHFRDINERFGHPAGDQALANVGATLRSTLRESDFAGRNGGEEFVVALPDTDLSGGIRAAETLRAAVSRINLPNLELRLTVSIGLAIYPDHAASAERLERSADAALYVAKRSGRNRVEVAASPPTGPTAPDDARALVTNGPS